MKSLLKILCNRHTRVNFWFHWSVLHVLFLCYCKQQALVSVRRAEEPNCVHCSVETDEMLSLKGSDIQTGSDKCLICSVLLTFIRNSHRGIPHSLFCLLLLPLLALYLLLLLQCFASLSLISAMCCFRGFCWLSKALQHCGICSSLSFFFCFFHSSIHLHLTQSVFAVFALLQTM